ncbi:anaerobic ribonucleoside-triphosphate reductase [Massilibacteroides sp.]|uniref:anaerobic ribonucleoside-triphosphate reductase n=1 Tax=Massilibacteroides sp. TaxID=2034766 RepID=UPI0026344F23|nr:anaerobic ribonucleoside-triphosphate reductase [Massilibacteroides sp.]MDD4516354.1 anaerobic ribonucleoside-triphosphate reductase [Massilibacteroides sp.]
MQESGLTAKVKKLQTANFNIPLKLTKNFVDSFNNLKETYGEKLLQLNGFADENLDYTSFIDNFVDEDTVSDASIDGNANVGSKDICTLEIEMPKPHLKLLGFNKIFYEMEKQFGLAAAKKALLGEWIGRYYLHDAYSSTLKPYCYAHDLEPLVKKGLFFIDNFNGGPPKHLSTFVDFVGEFVSFETNRLSGAVGLPNFLIYFYYFWKKDCENGYATFSPEYYRRQELQRIIYKLNQPYLRIIQSAFTNFSIFDRPYLESVFGGKEYPDGSFVVDYIEEIIELQKVFLEVCSDIRHNNMMTFPVLSYSLLFQDGHFVDQEFARFCCKHNMLWNDSNFFTSGDITSLSNCCRLLSDVKSMGYFNSIGGTALEVGSVKVNTINLARIAYEADGEEESYMEILEERVVECCRILHVVRSIIQRNIEKGLLTNFNHGLIRMDSLYNTIGINGLYEAVEHFGFIKEDAFGNKTYSNKGVEFAEEIFELINRVKDEFAADKNYKINVEQIPGERAAAILMQKDIEFYPEAEYTLPLYGNQWIPLGIKTTLQEKISLSAILDKACNGGSIAHINLDAPIEDFDTAWNLLNRIAQEGVIYFAFNVKISACANNHGFYGEQCPHCGGKKKTTYQRIVGFLTPETTYSKERKKEFNLREWLGKGDL